MPDDEGQRRILIVVQVLLPRWAGLGKGEYSSKAADELYRI